MVHETFTHIEKVAFSGHLGRLLEIPEPPKELYIEGSLPSKDHYLLCVVGSRKFSTYGKQVVEKLISGLSGHPISIVSGLALGMDALAHQAAINAGLHTVAVPGSGLSRKVLHPRTNHNLANNIVDEGGCLLSEYQPEQSAAIWTFPKRNRIMAGLSHAVLVIEAAKPSGTLITSRLATEYNRDVLTVPGSIFNNTAAGTNWLLTQGATPITSSEDILSALGLDQQPEQQRLDLDLDNFTEDEQTILKVLQQKPLSRDDLIRESGLSADKANVTLSALELKGYINENLGQIYITI